MVTLTNRVCTVYIVHSCALILNMRLPFGTHMHLVKDVKKLENVQKFAMKMCLKQWDLGYQELLELSQLPSLQNRRLYLKLCTLYKIIHGYFYFPSNVFVPQVSRNNSSLLLLYQPLAHTSAFQSSFVVCKESLTARSTYRTAHSITSF